MSCTPALPLAVCGLSTRRVHRAAAAGEFLPDAVAAGRNSSAASAAAALRPGSAAARGAA